MPVIPNPDSQVWRMILESPGLESCVTRTSERAESETPETGSEDSIQTGKICGDRSEPKEIGSRSSAGVLDIQKGKGR